MHDIKLLCSVVHELRGLSPLPPILPQSGRSPGPLTTRMPCQASVWGLGAVSRGPALWPWGYRSISGSWGLALEEESAEEGEAAQALSDGSLPTLQRQYPLQSRARGRWGLSHQAPHRERRHSCQTLPVRRGDCVLCQHRLPPYFRGWLQFAGLTYA